LTLDGQIPKQSRVSEGNISEPGDIRENVE